MKSCKIVNFCKTKSYIIVKINQIKNCIIENTQGDVVPLEITSGRTPRAHEALNKLLATSEYGIEKGYVLSRLNVEQRDRVVYLPWYVTACLPEALGLRERIDEEDSFSITLPPLENRAPKKLK